MTASILQQFLALSSGIIYSWQWLLKKWEAISREKNSSIYLKDFTDLDFFFSLFSFSLSNACFTSSVTQGICCTLSANRFVGSETPKHNDFDQFWKFKFYFKHFHRNTQFLSFDGPSNYLYFAKLKFLLVLFEKIPSFVCLVFKVENKWILRLQNLFS